MSQQPSPPTHEVLNQPPFLEAYNLLERDPILTAGLARERAEWARARAIASTFSA